MVVGATRPLVRAWRSPAPLDRYALVHLASVAADTLVAVALADSVFFSLPVGEAQTRVAAYLALTMAPLAVAAPLVVPLLDRAGPRRAVAIGAAGARAIACVALAPRADTVALFPLAFALLALGKVHGIAKNGLTLAYASDDEGLVEANARLGRFAVAGAALAGGPAVAILSLGGARSVLVTAAAVYAVSALMNLRLPRPRAIPRADVEVGRRGSVPALAAPAIGAAGLRAASGFLLFALAFALRRSGEPTWWFGVLGAAGAAGGLLGDVIAPRLPARLREEAVVAGCVIGVGIGAVLAFAAFSLPVLVAFAVAMGASVELGRLAFQSLMQQHAPGGAHGRVFVRYEVLFQLAWVAGAMIPSMLPIGFREAFLGLAVLALVAVIGYLTPDLLGRRR